MGREDKAGHNHQESFQAVQANSGRSNGPLFLLVIEFSQSHIACSDLARHRECDPRHARNMLVPPLRKLVGVPRELENAPGIRSMIRNMLAPPLRKLVGVLSRVGEFSWRPAILLHAPLNRGCGCQRSRGPPDQEYVP